MNGSDMLWISASEVFERVTVLDAVRAVQRHLQGGADPAEDFDRSVLPVSHGQVLIMPSDSAEFFGVKVASVAPANPGRGRERIQGVYLLMDAETLTPSALIDGAALTTLRTPAVSAAAADLLAPAEVEHMVVFGSGPQAEGHVAAMKAVRPIGRVTVVARNAERASDFARKLRAEGTEARTGTSGDVREAQLIVCATTARDPLFDGGLVPSDSCTVAVGSHEPDARELDVALLGRAQVVVEDVATALREAGDVMIPVSSGSLDPASLVPLRDVVLGAREVDVRRPRVFKSTGMAWEDLVVAAALFRAVRSQDGSTSA
ncbi:ornithine cyclodeaminase family protein [Microbacterium sp. NPDC058342]|uniref:ornithine cyclodeaminase family protein n=1 Tax=Microbacterium sp. NPDC058342 TaxID=3346454 RepID=UPI0036610002